MGSAARDDLLVLQKRAHKVHTWVKNKERALKHAHESFGWVFETWLTEQQRDLDELKSAAKAYIESTQSLDELTQNLRGLVARVICHYENYYKVKSESAKQNVFCMLTPAWRSLLEHAFLWIGGCRPSTTFQLLYTIEGLHVESKLIDLLNGSLKIADIGGLSPSQLARIDELQMITIKEERELTEKLASFQDTLADFSMFELSRKSNTQNRVEPTLWPKDDMLAEIFGKANDLRMKTLKKAVEILSPIQAVDFLIAAAQLHLRVHQWGMEKDAPKS